MLHKIIIYVESFNTQSGDLEKFGEKETFRNLIKETSLSKARW